MARRTELVIFGELDRNIPAHVLAFDDRALTRGPRPRRIRRLNDPLGAAAVGLNVAR